MFAELDPGAKKAFVDEMKEIIELKSLDFRTTLISDRISDRRQKLVVNHAVPTTRCRVGIKFKTVELPLDQGTAHLFTLALYSVSSCASIRLLKK